VWASLRATRGQGRRAVEAPSAPPFRVATEEEMAEVEPLWRRSGDRRDTPEPTRTP
jgi:tellurite resistance protein TerC